MKKKPIKREPLKTVLVIPDLHVPYHDVQAWNLLLQICRSIRPSEIVIIGDFLDLYSVSSFSKNPRRKLLLEDEIEEANIELDKLAGIAPVVYIEGNHEARLSKYLHDRAPALDGLITVPGALRLKERGIRWVPYKTSYKLGKVSYTHDVGFSGPSSARASLAAYGGNLVFGHSHLGSVEYSGSVRGDSHFVLNVGHMCDIEAVDYYHRDLARRRWRCGFGLVTYAGDLAFAQFVPIVHGCAVVNGKEFRAT